ncbi:hypothetical protein D3C73_424630 [compost metagenome]
MKGRLLKINHDLMKRDEIGSNGQLVHYQFRAVHVFSKLLLYEVDINAVELEENDPNYDIEVYGKHSRNHQAEAHALKSHNNSPFPDACCPYST